MIAATTFAGQTVAVFGLGGSGLAVCQSLTVGGAGVAAWDDGEPARTRALAAGVSLVDLRAADWSAFAALVLAPGVPLTHPKPHWTVDMAHAAGVEIIGDVEIFCRERARHAPNAPFVAITGTNGKSTTTALIAHVLRSADNGMEVAVGGNIGTAVLSLPPVQAQTAYVVEMSSYQIDLTPSLAPSVGVLLNVTPDHIDRHGTFENYAAVKERLIAASANRIVSIDDDTVRAVAQRHNPSSHPVTTISADPSSDADVVCEGAVVRVASDGATFDLEGIATLRGKHNAQNAMAAIAAARILTCGDANIARGLATFPGLAHRMQPIARLGRVLFVNDSKATNADSADKALAAFDGGIRWIAGGRAKEGGIEPLRPHFHRIAKAYLIGECANAFAATLAPTVPFETCGTLDVAVAAAARDAARDAADEPVVLLSPACASFDQYRNFETRGDAFVAAVADLPGVDMLARAPT